MKIFAIPKTSPEMPENLAKALKISAAANLALVSGNGNPRMVMEQMILKICTL